MFTLLFAKVEDFIKERNYHLTREEVMEAVKNAVESSFDSMNKKVVFDLGNMTILELCDTVKERPPEWVFRSIKPQALLVYLKEYVERCEREKIYALFRRFKGSIIKAEAIGETFHLGYKGKNVIDIRERFEGPLRDFGKLHGIYVEKGQEPITIPVGQWILWDLAKFIYDASGYCLSINPHKKILRLKEQPKAVLWNVNGVDAIMPSDERIAEEDYVGLEWDVILYNVNQTSLESFQLYVSRRQIDFLVNYLYYYIPEFKSVKIKGVARYPGVMSKVLIETNGSRFNVGQYKDILSDISKKLMGEKIEIVFHSKDTDEVLRSALNYDGSIKVNSLEKSAVVITDRKGKVIGKDGLNVKLTGMLTGYKISVMSTDEYINGNNIFSGEPPSAAEGI